MSSHHIVRDQQEPALLITHSTGVDQEILGSLLEWSPTILVVDNILDDVISWGIKIDVVLAAEQNFELIKRQMSQQAPVKVISYHQEKSNTRRNFAIDISNAEGSEEIIAEEAPYMVAFYYLLVSKFNAVNILTSLTPSEILINFAKSVSFSNRLDLAFFTPEYKGIIPKADIFQKWVLQNLQILIGPTDKYSRLLLSGFKDIEDRAEVEIRKLGTFYSRAEGIISIEKVEGENYILFEKLN